VTTPNLLFEQGIRDKGASTLQECVQLIVTSTWSIGNRVSGDFAKGASSNP
jgi:hypothetical protein